MDTTQAHGQSNGAPIYAWLLRGLRWMSAFVTQYEVYLCYVIIVIKVRQSQ
jgi:hypothetical protein